MSGEKEKAENLFTIYNIVYIFYIREDKMMKSTDWGFEALTVQSETLRDSN